MHKSREGKLHTACFLCRRYSVRFPAAIPEFLSHNSFFLSLAPLLPWLSPLGGSRFKNGSFIHRRIW